MRHFYGWSLVELMVSASISGILLTIAVPNFHEFTTKIRVDNEIYDLQRLLLVTRNSAINSGRNTILCSLDGGSVCTGKWHQELSVFVDSNNNQKFDDVDEWIIKVKPPINSGDKLLFGKGRLKITYAPTGILSGLSNGTFRYCPKGRDDLARGIILSVSGRFYLSTDTDGDGEDENRSNKSLTCS